MINALELLRAQQDSASERENRRTLADLAAQKFALAQQMAPGELEGQRLSNLGKVAQLQQMPQEFAQKVAQQNALMDIRRQGLTRQDRAEQANENYRQEQLRIERAKADPFGLMGGGQPGTPNLQTPGINPNAPPLPGQDKGGITGMGQPQAQPNPNAQPGSVLSRITPDTHGDEFLAKLPPSVAGQVKALAEGRMAFPTGMSLRSPIVQQMLGLVSQYDPTFDAVNYQGRNKTYTSFTGGADAEKVKNINQTLHHAGQLNEAIDKLDNFSGIGTPLNYAVNPIEKAFGDPRQGVFEQKAQAVASELRKVYSGAGGGGLAELEKWESSLPVNASKTQQKAYLKSGMELLNGALSAMQEKYQAGMGPRANVGNLLKPESREILNRLAPGTLKDSGTPENTGAAPTASAFPTLPDPSKYSGKTATDTSTNIKYRSNGSQWLRIP